MKISVTLRCFILFLITALSFSCKPLKEVKKINVVNQSIKDGVIKISVKKYPEDAFVFRGDYYLRYSGEQDLKGLNGMLMSFDPEINFYKVEYYVSDQLIKVSEYTKEELLVKKQGQLIIGKRGKVRERPLRKYYRAR